MAELYRFSASFHFPFASSSMANSSRYSICRRCRCMNRGMEGEGEKGRERGREGGREGEREGGMARGRREGET